MIKLSVDHLARVLGATVLRAPARCVAPLARSVDTATVLCGSFRTKSHHKVRKTAKWLALLESGSFDLAALQRGVERLVNEAPTERARQLPSALNCQSDSRNVMWSCSFKNVVTGKCLLDDLMDRIGLQEPFQMIRQPTAHTGIGESPVIFGGVGGVGGTGESPLFFGGTGERFAVRPCLTVPLPDVNVE